jgi:hypothetical protein
MEPTTIGLDLAKNVFQIHAIAADGTIVYRRRLRRSELREFFAKREPCLGWRPAPAPAIGHGSWLAWQRNGQAGRRAARQLAVHP